MTDRDNGKITEETDKSEVVITATIKPRILEHGKFFRNGAASEFYNLRYTANMDVDSKTYRERLKISSSNPVDTVTFGYFSFGPQSVGFVQAVNSEENKFGGSGTNRPFVQKRISVVDPKTLLDLYTRGIRPLASTLIDEYPKEKPYLLQRYETVFGQTEEPLTVETNVDTLCKIHKDPGFRELAIKASEAILSKRLNKIGNPVVLEHSGELTPQVLVHLLDTVNVLTIAINHNIASLSVINTPSMENYSEIDLVVKDISAKQTTVVYPSYIVNRAGQEQDILQGHYSTPPFRANPQVLKAYDDLHASRKDWVKNHALILKRD